MIEIIIANFICDKCGEKIPVRLDPAYVCPISDWSMMDIAEDVLRGLASSGDVTDDGFHFCQQCWKNERLQGDAFSTPAKEPSGPPPRPVPPTTDRILEGETRPRKLQPIINCDCGFTIDCRNDRGKEVECPQCGNQYTRKAALTGDE